MSAINKDVALAYDDGTDKTYIGAEEVTRNRENELESYAKPNEIPPSHRAQNMNKIKEQISVKAKMTDEATQILNSEDSALGDGDKENLVDRLDEFYESTELLKLYYGDREYTGYISQIEYKERGRYENSVYDITLDFLIAVPMNS